jgi:hypothetical protein
MSRRTLGVLSRFPAHLDAARAGKQLYAVADTVASILDDLSASLAAVRRAHRLAHADATVDIGRLGALHRIGADDFAAIDRRLARLRGAAAELRAAVGGGDDAARDASAERLCDLLAVRGPAPRLALFAPAATPPAPPDLKAAAAVLLAAVAALTGYAGRRESLRARVGTVCAIHARGNGTVRALLEAAASALDMQLDDDRARRFVEELRPAVTVTQAGAAGTTRYAYVVIARSQSKSVDRRSAVAEIATGNAALGAADCNVVAWATPPDARDFLVFRVANGADPAKVGLLTPIALPATATSFRDTGQPATGGAAIDPEIDDALFHSRDRFWHAAFVRERAPVLPGAPPADEVIGMEENPVRRERSPALPSPPAPRAHGELFDLYRRGFGRSLLRIEVTGIDDRSIGPMLVNRDEGRGIGFSGRVAAGRVLVFDEAGRVVLDGADVTAAAYAWTGACFAGDDDDPAAPHDFVFAGPGVPADRRAVFAVATPFDALDGAFAFPGPGDPLPVPGIGVGRTRFAFFAQEAHFSAVEARVHPAVPIPLSPRPLAGFLDGSVFAPPGGPVPPAAAVALSWLEHEAYAVRILLPRRYAQFDGAGAPAMAELVRRALERHRPAGVEGASGDPAAGPGAGPPPGVRVEYVEDRWILGGSDVAGASTADPILSLRGGSVLWIPPRL